jgi:hypothetical protein
MRSASIDGRAEQTVRVIVIIIGLLSLLSYLVKLSYLVNF